MRENSTMPQLCIFGVLILLSFIPCSISLTFNFSYHNFKDSQHINATGDAFINANGILDLTSTDRDRNLQYNTGWAIYTNPIAIYDTRIGFAADFQTNFSFQIFSLSQNCSGDGLTFFMASANWTSSRENSGHGLGIFNTSSAADKSQIIAVEFDTYQNDFDPNGNHMGIDVKSFLSSVTAPWVPGDGNSFSGTAFVQYNSTTGKLSSLLRNGSDILQGYIHINVNLTDVLPENVTVGFSASTGRCSEAHQISSWSFSATIPTAAAAPATLPTPATVSSQPAETAPPLLRSKTATRISKMAITLMACLVPLFIIVIIIVMVVIKLRKKKRERAEEEMHEEEEEEIDGSMDVTMNFETGPRKFSYRELAAATNYFSKEGKLGEGGFGGVYRGTLSDTNDVVAVKRFSKGSSQGKKEYVAEVSVISRLRHRNLVRLIGWCHERGEFLLVYEYMEGGSLDSHLFGKKGCPVLPWAHRRKVMLDLASAVLYLHEEWEQCVVHRDIKLSNVMVDSEFNARLGDFGLARLSNHGFAPRTTMVAGTMGYLAPECVFTGKANTQSDVYSFGIVLLEITTGRRAIRPIGEKEARLAEWVWEFYGVGSLMAAVDERLGSDFDEQEMERMMVVGLWCIYPDPERRPTMKDAIRVLNFQADIPSLPKKMPVPIYAQPLNIEPSSSFTNSSYGTTTTSTTISSTDSATAVLLRSQG